MKFLLGTLFLLSITSLTSVGQGKTASPSLQLTLPSLWYGVPDVPVSLYYDNVILTENPDQYHFTIKCDIGTPETRRWTVTPTSADTGDHAMEVSVADAEGKVLETAKTTLRIVDAKASRPLRLLIVGDSLTAATLYPNKIAALLNTPGNASWTMLGTNRKPDSGSAGVVHEGYGGWTWASFLRRYEPKPERSPDGKSWKKRSSPFIYLENGKPELDIARYIKEECAQQPPDVVTFLLGINDCFRLKPSNPALVDPSINAVLDNADKLLAAFHSAAPQATLAVALTPPANARESGFEANYHGAYHRWEWKRIQHRLVQRMIERLGHRQSDGIYLVPVELNIDPVDGFPNNNAVHPNLHGYTEIGCSFYAWLKAWMAGGLETK